MLEPFSVAEICFAAQARLFAESSQESVVLLSTPPFHISAAHSTAFRVPSLSRATVFPSFCTSWPPNAHRTGYQAVGPSPGAWPRATPIGVFVAWTISFPYWSSSSYGETKFGFPACAQRSLRKIHALATYVNGIARH